METNWPSAVTTGRLQRLGWGTIYTWPLLAMAVLYRASHDVRQVWLSGFFVLTLLWPTTLLLAYRSVAGGVAVAGLCLALLFTQLIVGRPIVRPNPQELERPFDSPSQRATYMIDVPNGSREWNELWALDPQPIAMLYIQLALEAGVDEPGLDVRLNGEPLGRLTRASSLRGNVEFGARRREWHRLALPQTVLQRAAALQVEVRPSATAFISGGVALLGGFSYRPLHHNPSAFFDAERQVTEPCELLPRFHLIGVVAPPIHYTSRLRYYVELRVAETNTGRLLRTVY